MKPKKYLFGLIPFLLATSLFGEELPAGFIKTIKGTAQIVRQGQTLAPRIGDKFYVGDTLRTGANSSLGVSFKDETLLSMGPNTRVVIKDFAFSPAEGKLSLAARILRGTVVFLSGIISKLAPDTVRLETPYANIGFRGTRVAVEVKGDV